MRSNNNIENIKINYKINRYKGYGKTKELDKYNAVRHDLSLSLRGCGL
jgi:hypothetical protein